MVLIIDVLQAFDDLHTRIHNRTEMERAGLRRIIEKCKAFGVEALDKQLKYYEDLDAEDRSQLLQDEDAGLLRSFSDPQDIYATLLRSVENTPAQPYFLSALQHLLLIRADDEVRVRYFQLIDHLITSVVMDKKPGFREGLSDTIGVSVARLVAQFGEQERAQKAEDETAAVRAELARVVSEKEVLEDELQNSGEGRVGQLRDKLQATEERLAVARQQVEHYKQKLADEKQKFDDRIEQLEAQILELFRQVRSVDDIRMIEETSQQEELTGEQMIGTFIKTMERTKTFSILEGRTPKRGGKIRRSSTNPQAIAEDIGDVDGTEDGAEIVDLARTPQPKRTTQARVHRSNGGSTGAGGLGAGGSSGANGIPRASQFLDADDEDAHQQLEETMATGSNNLVRRFFYQQCVGPLIRLFRAWAKSHLLEVFAV